MTIQKAIARAWSDADYKQKLLDNPHEALAEVGVEIPAGKTVKVIENNADAHHIVLPEAPAEAGGLAMEEMERLAGGTGWGTQVCTDSGSGC